MKYELEKTDKIALKPTSAHYVTFFFHNKIKKFLNKKMRSFDWKLVLQNILESR